MLERAESLQQFVREVGDLQEPLAQLALLDQRARSPAATVYDLLVGQHGHIDRIPIDRRFLAIDQPGAEQVEKQCLFVTVIIRLAGGEFAAPVDRQPEPTELRLHRRDIRAGPRAGIDGAFHRGVLRRHTKRIPPHRVQDFAPLHSPETGEHVAHHVVAPVPDMDPSGRIRKHLQHISSRLGRGIVSLEGLALVPDLLPRRVRLQRVEPRRHDRTLSRPRRRGACRGPWSGSGPPASAPSRRVPVLRPSRRRCGPGGSRRPTARRRAGPGRGSTPSP